MRTQQTITISSPPFTSQGGVQTAPQWKRPWPLPRPAAGAGGSTVERGFLIVSSTDTIRHAASEAAVRALMRTMAGSHTNAWKLSVMSSLLIHTTRPYHRPPCACQARSLLRIFVPSKPALSHSCCGILSRALAYAPINSCYFPGMVLE